MKKLNHGGLSKIMRYQSERFSRLVDMEARYGICVRGSRESNNLKSQLERKKRKRKDHHKEKGEDNAGRPKKVEGSPYNSAKALYVKPKGYGRHSPRPDHEYGNAELLSEVMTRLIQETIAMGTCVLAKEKGDNGWLEAYGNKAAKIRSRRK
jgi:hypothetical protein